MKRWIGLAVALFLGASVALAKTSEENRQDSWVLIGVTPIGADVPTLLTSPMAGAALKNQGFTNVSVVPLVTAGVYIGRSWLVALDYGSTSATYKQKATSTTGATEGDLKYSNVGGYARWFVGNSFNIMLAAHQRSWTVDGSTTQHDAVFNTDVNVRAKLDASATVGSIGIGNQWLTDFGLTIGFDWLVGSAVLDSKTTAKFDGTAVDPLTGTVYTASQLDPATVAQAKADMNKTGKDLNTIAGLPGAFILTLGWSF